MILVLTGFTLNLIKGPVALGVSLTLNDELIGLLGASYHPKRYESRAGVMEGILMPGQGSSSIELNDAETRRLSTIEGLICGGVAGACAKSFIAPADRVKILYQVDRSRAFSLGAAIGTGRSIVANSGVAGLWRGNGAMMLRVVPYAGITYSTFDQYEDMFVRLLKKDERDVLTRFLSGAAAGATATLCTYPLDLLRARMAAHWSMELRYSSYTSAIKEIIAKEGGMALFSGLRPTLIGIVPYAGLSFSAFHTMKAKSMAAFEYRRESDIPTQMRLLMGGLAGLFAQSATYPLDIVRRRMQVEPNAYSSTWDALRTIYSKVHKDPCCQLLVHMFLK